MTVRSEDTYLFIDGEYLQSKYRDAMRAVFNLDGEISFSEIKRQAKAKRAFFYHCLDDVRRGNETDESYSAKIRDQEAYFESIRAIEGFHVPLGTLRGMRKRRQKEVDVLLATDMLTHGYDGNMEKAILIAGDLDFRPVVEALVRRGVFVEIWYEPKSLATELRWAADHGRKLDFNELYSWSSKQFSDRNILPTCSKTHHALISLIEHKRGTYEGLPVRLMEDRSSSRFHLQVNRVGHILWFEHSNMEVLLGYFEATHGPIL